MGRRLRAQAGPTAFSTMLQASLNPGRARHVANVDQPTCLLSAEPTSPLTFLDPHAHRGEYLQVAVVDILTSYYRKSAVPLTRSCGFLCPAFVSSRGPLRYQHGVGVGPMLRPVD
jgi:hypothetical protein